MITYMVCNTLSLLRFLQEEQRLAGAKARTQGVPTDGGLLGQKAGYPLVAEALSGHGADVEPADRKRIEELLKVLEGDCKDRELGSALARVKRIRDRLNRLFFKYDELETELRVLIETIEDDLDDRYFYYYPQDKAKLLNDVEQDWKLVLGAFPSAKNDIWGAVDCYAVGQSTASIFHLMRLAEYGLRALARERRVKLPRRKPLEWQDWQVIINSISDSVKKIAGKKRGPARDVALEFYHGALGHFEAFKEVYRNNVMHARKDYGSLEALSVLNHVREFMTRLSSRITETTNKQIAWGVRN